MSCQGPGSRSARRRRRAYPLQSLKLSFGVEWFRFVRLAAGEEQDECSDAVHETHGSLRGTDSRCPRGTGPNQPRSGLAANDDRLEVSSRGWSAAGWARLGPRHPGREGPRRRRRVEQCEGGYPVRRGARRPLLRRAEKVVTATVVVPLGTRAFVGFVIQGLAVGAAVCRGATRRPGELEPRVVVVDTERQEARTGEAEGHDHEGEKDVAIHGRHEARVANTRTPVHGSARLSCLLCSDPLPALPHECHRFGLLTRLRRVL